MTEAFHHGVRVLQKDSVYSPIETTDTSTIGLLYTAPNADAIYDSIATSLDTWAPDRPLDLAFFEAVAEAIAILPAISWPSTTGE